ncbi:MAG TPA: mRNA surveillance protein pelota [Thermoplasmata archaeon]|nr:mRNA surveillance protein pelota [Thermoplasmata archaeon]
MRVLQRDPLTGRLKLRVETPSDLWRLARLVRPGDRVGASTTRRDPEVPEDTPGADRSRRRVLLTVRVESSEFHGFSQHVRLTGPIVEGPFDIGRHHTLDLAERDDVVIEKDRWSAADELLIEEGTRRTGDPTVVVATVDWGESTIVRLRGRAIETVVDLRRTLSGKRYDGAQGDKDRRTYAGEVTALLVKEVPGALALVVAGPGFLKEEIGKRLVEAAPEAAKKLRIVATSESGRAGLDELLRSGKAEEALAGSMAAEEASGVEALLTALSGGRRAAVGIAEVREATEGGAVESLLVAESLLPDPATGELLDAARRGRARVLIVRDEGEPGKRLAGLGRIAAILRYDWAPAAGRTRAAGKGA